VGGGKCVLRVGGLGRGVVEGGGGFGVGVVWVLIEGT